MNLKQKNTTPKPMKTNRVKSPKNKRVKSPKMKPNKKARLIKLLFLANK